jgi:hypothetical protein
MTTRLLPPAVVFATLLAVLYVPPLLGGDTDKNEGVKTERNDRFVQVVRDKSNSPIALQSAIVRHVPQDCGQTSPTVDLIAAVHIGQQEYFEQLNKVFKGYDIVLYELVAPEGTTVPKGGVEHGPSNPVTGLQTGMTDLLELKFQLNVVDYTARNFVHADMSPKQFLESMNQRQEGVMQMFGKALGYALSQQGGKNGDPAEGATLMALFSKNRAIALRRVLASQFEDMEGQLNAINGPEGSTIISERNKVALSVLKKELAAGKKNIAIFYGAGHMADMQKRLDDDFGLVPVSTQWITAWDMADPKPKR